MTADIEKKTFYGMHGPREVVLVLVDNGRSSIEEASMLSCINCGSCLLRCPVYDQIGKDFGGHAYLGGRGAAFTQRLDGTAAAVEAGLSLCTSCGLCTEMCPVRCDTPRLVRQARRVVLADGAKHPMEVSALVKSVRNYHNPWMQPRQARSRWADGLGLRGRGPVLYFAGCSPSLLFPETSRATVELLRAAGVEPSYLGKDEVCCGSTLRKLGEEDLFLKVAEEGARRIKASGAERVITACPGCYRALSEYRRLFDGFDLEVEHASQTLARLVDEGRVRFSVANTRVAWHDPCDLGRLGGVYDEPRKVLEAMHGLELREMRENRARSQCCGSGGGVKTAHPQLAERIGARRVDEAVRAGADALVTACPWCEANLRDARASEGREMEVLDLMVLAWRSLTR
jgi:Fe-S oxidoreductase